MRNIRQRISTAFILSMILSLIGTFDSLKVSAQWVDVGPGSQVNENELRHIFSLAVVDEESIWAAPIQPAFLDVREIVRTVDGGVTWDVTLLPEADGNHVPVRIFAPSADEAWVVAPRYPSPNRNKLYHTTDGGATWQDVPGGFNQTNKGVQNVHFFNDQEGVLFGSPRTGTASIDVMNLYRTADGGQTWTQLTDPQAPIPIEGESYFLFSGNDSYAAVGDTLWFVTSLNRVYRTIDKGQNWQIFNTGLPGSSTIAGLASVAFKDAMNGMVVSFVPQQGAITTNGGSSWTVIEMPETPNARCVQYIPGTENTYILTDGYEGNSPDISITFDGGQSWETLSGNPGFNCVSFQSTTEAWAGSNISGSVGGIYRWTADLATVLNVQTASTANTVIYPNPTSDKLFLKVEPASAFEVEVTVTDLTGRVFIQQKLASIGNAFFDVRHLPQGLYLVTVNSQDQHFVSKFIKTN